MQDYKYADKSYSYYDWMSRDYYKYLLNNAEKVYWEKPGNTGTVKRENFIKREAEYAYNKACEAIDDFSKGYSYSWHKNWRDLYGARFPES